METIYGLTAEERLQEMTADDAVKMVRELCAQLGDDAESFHGNIWPKNITFDFDGRAILGDGSDAPASDRAAEQVEYLAPEFFWDNIGSGAADVYSLGLVLYAACNGGYLPFQPKGGALTDKDRSGALRKRMKGERIRLPSGVTPELGAVIKRALAYTPEERYLSAPELLTALGATDEALPGAEEAIGTAEALTRELGRADAEEPEAAEAPDGTASLSAEEAEDAAETLPPETLEAADAEADAAPDAASDAPVADGADGAAETAEETAEESSSTLAAETDKKYTVQKDFEKRGKRKKTEAPASAKKQKKRLSPVIVVLCVAAVAVIGAAAALLLLPKNEPAASEDPQEVSEPYILTPVEPTEPTEDAAVTPSLGDDETEDPDTDEQAGTTEDAEPERVGSETVDGQEVSPVSDTVYATGSGVNLRTGPSTTYEIGRSISRGTALERTGTVNGWSQVQYDGEEYYVSNSLISATNPNGTNVTETAEATPAPEATPAGTDKSAESADTSSDTGKSTGAGTGTGTGSGTASAPSDVVYTGTVTTSTRDIVRVTSDANIRSGAGTNYSVLDTAKTGVILQRTGVTGSWSRVIVGGREGYVYNTLISPVEGSKTTDAVGSLKIVSKANIRSGPDTKYDVLGICDVGTELSITGLADGKWYRVSYKGGDGYVNRTLISVTDFALVRDAAGGIKLKADGNIRSGPGTGYEALGTVKSGDSFDITGVTDTNWYQVTYEGETGYIAGNLAEKVS